MRNCIGIDISKHSFDVFVLEKNKELVLNTLNTHHTQEKEGKMNAYTRWYSRLLLFGGSLNLLFAVPALFGPDLLINFYDNA